MITIDGRIGCLVALRGACLQRLQLLFKKGNQLLLVNDYALGKKGFNGLSFYSAHRLPRRLSQLVDIDPDLTDARPCRRARFLAMLVCLQDYK